ncbi:chloride channel protein [Alphaproteobacteria bacterium]|nr:chloride channel protein [Alphaproteobacteria bacterium]
MSLASHSALDSENPHPIILLFASFFSACVIGVLVGLFTISFVQLITEAEFWRVAGRIGLESLSFSLFSYQTGLLSAGMVVLILIRRIFSIQRWHGPADVIHAAHTDISLLSVKTGAATLASVFISVFAGGSVGIYGPLVHVGGFLARLFHSLFRTTILSQDMLLGCGVAAAISAGFNAPIAGMIFAHEVVLRHFSMRALAPIAIASISSFSISSWLFEEVRWLRLDIEVPSILSLSSGLLISGLFFGLVAVFIMRLQIGSSKWAANSGLSDWKLGGIAVIICSLVGFFVPEVLGLGPATIQEMLNLQFGIVALFIFLASKLIVTAASTCFGFSLGIFSPCLFMGAAAGGVSAHVLGLLGIPVSVPIFMVCGMAALSGAVTGAPIAIMVIVIEMTTSYDLAVATMISVGTCSLITFSFGGHSLFDQQLEMRKVNINAGRVVLRLSEMKVDSLAKTDFITVQISSSAKAAARLLAANKTSEGYCVKDDGSLLGKIGLQDLVAKENLESLDSIVEINPTFLQAGSSVESAREVAADFIGEALPVLEGDTRKLLGIVSEADIFTAVLKTQKDVNSLEKT